MQQQQLGQTSGVVNGPPSNISSLGDTVRNAAPAGVPWVQNQAQSVRVARNNPAQTDVLREMQALIARMTPQQAQQAQTVLNDWVCRRVECQIGLVRDLCILMLDQVSLLQAALTCLFRQLV